MAYMAKVLALGTTVNKFIIIKNKSTKILIIKLKGSAFRSLRRQRKVRIKQTFFPVC